MISKAMYPYGICLVTLLLIVTTPGLQCFANDVKFPTPSYEGEDLAQVREWEKTWAGKKVTSAEVDQVKDFLHEAVYKAMKEPQIFGVQSLWFEIVPYREYTVSQGMVDATKKYAPHSKLDAQEGLVNFGDVAGIPFPQPETGAEMAWNFDSSTKGDTHYIFNEEKLLTAKADLNVMPRCCAGTHTG